MRRPLIALELASLFQLVVVVAPRQDFHPLLEAPLNLPGVRLRLFPSGVSYLSQVANNILAEQLPRINIPNVEHRLPGDQGAIFISRIKISRFIGDLSGAVNIVVPFNLTGQAEVQAEGLSVQLDSAMERGPNGSAHISSIACHSTIRAVDVVNHNGGLFGLAVTVFKQGVSDNVRLMLQGLICKKVRKYLDEDLNEKLAEVQTRSPLSEAIETNAIRATKLSKAVGGATLGSLLGKPTFVSWVVGDVGGGEDCFYKHQFGFGPVLLQRLIRLHLSPSSPGVSQFLQTSCENSFCIADLVPQLAETYPNHTLELSLASTRAPAVLFSEKKGGVISVSLGGVVVVFVFDGVRRKQAAVLDVEIVADAKLNLQDRTVSGSVQLTKFELSSRSGTVKISRDELSDISILVSQMIENMLNEMLTNGFPLPLPHVIRLQNVALEVLNRRILIRTDITVDERRLSQLAEKTLFSGPQFGRQFVRENTLRTFKRMASH
nr:Lipid-binding serum glycoprotein domain containing protein [Haemonchus contortus]